MKRINFRGGGMDMGNAGNRSRSASMGNTSSRSRSTSSNTGGGSGNLGGGGGGQNSVSRRYSPPTRPTYTSANIDNKPVTGADFRNSRVNTIRPTQNPFEGLGGLMKTALGFAIPGSNFLLNQGGALKQGIMNLNNRLQNSDFGQSRTLMDYLDARSYGGRDARDRKASQTMREARAIQTAMDLRQAQPIEETYTFDDINTVAPQQVNIPSDRFSDYTMSEPRYSGSFPGASLFSGYGSAEASVPDDMLAKTPVEEFRDQTYKNIATGSNSFFDSLYNPGQISDLENLYARQYGIDNTSGGIISNARHMAAMNNLSNTIAAPFNKISEPLGTFIGDAGAFAMGAAGEVPALFRGLNRKNLGEIGEDLVANFRGSFGTPNQTTAEQIYQNEFDSYNNDGIATLFNK